MITGEQLQQTSIANVATIKGYRYGVKGSCGLWRPVRTPCALNDRMIWVSFNHPAMPPIIECSKDKAIERMRGILDRIKHTLRTNPSMYSEAPGASDGQFVLPDSVKAGRSYGQMKWKIRKSKSI